MKKVLKKKVKKYQKWVDYFWKMFVDKGSSAAPIDLRTPSTSPPYIPPESHTKSAFKYTWNGITHEYEGEWSKTELPDKIHEKLPDDENFVDSLEVKFPIDLFSDVEVLSFIVDLIETYKFKVSFSDADDFYYHLGLTTINGTSPFVYTLNKTA